MEGDSGSSPGSVDLVAVRKCGSVHGTKGREVDKNCLIKLEELNRCKSHPDEEVTTYCQTCGSLICLECLVEDATHRQHRKITIKKLIASPQFFSEVFHRLSKLLDQTTEHLDNLKEDETRIITGHQNQIRNIQDIEKKAIKELNQGLQVEAGKLKSAVVKQKNHIKEIAKSAIASIEQHQTGQASKIQAERDVVEAILPDLSILTETMKQKPAPVVLNKLVQGHQQSGQLLASEAREFVIKGVKTSAPNVNIKDMDNFTRMTARVTSLSETRDGDAQTEAVIQATSSQSTLASLRKRVLALVPASVTTCSSGHAVEGAAVLTRDCHIHYRKFALGEVSTLCHYEEPDVTKPVDVRNEVTFIKRLNADALSSITGGQVSLTLKQGSSGRWDLENGKGELVCCNAWFFNERGDLHTNRTGKYYSGASYLPAASKVGDALQQYFNWRPSAVIDRDTGKTVDIELTVKEWRDSFSSRKLTVLK